MDRSTAQVPPPIPLADSRPARRSFVERLLDPRSIQYLLGSGGVLLVAGLVIWLASLGVFDNPWIVAGGMGAATLAVMAGGWALLKRSRHTLAGRAITLLACLVMPLNLWFYHANDLITIQGHLWIAALACCVLYGLSALILRDPLFVHVLVAGVASTGLLILADMNRLAEIASPSVLLMVLGLIALHVERAFAADESRPFSRGTFGRACFVSAQFLIAGSLGLLAGAQVTGYAHLPNLVGALPALVTDRWLQILAIAVTVAGAYACVYSAIVVRQSAKYFYVAVGLVLWAEAQAIHTLNFARIPYALILMLTVSGVAAHLVAHALRKRSIPGVSTTMRHAAMALSLLPILYGVYLFINHGAYIAGNVAVLKVAGSIIAAAAACRWGAYMARAEAAQARICIGGSAIGIVVAGSMGLGYFGLTDTIRQVPWLMLAPVGYMAAAAARRQEPVAKTLRLVGNLLCIVVLLGGLAAIADGSGDWRMPMAEALGLAAAGYALAAVSVRRSIYVYVASAFVALAAIVFLSDRGASNLVSVSVLAALALAQVAAGRVITARSSAPAGEALKQSGLALVVLLSVGQSLFALSQMIDDATGVSTAVALGVTAIAAALAATMTSIGAKRALLALSIGQAVLAMAMLAHLSELAAVRKLEIFNVALGIVLLALGHAAWYREQSDSTRSGLASVGLTLGSLLLAIPLLIAVVVTRCTTGLSLPDELALLTAGMALFVAGALLEIRSTTLTGAVALGIHLVILLISAGMRAQLAVGVYLSAGGGLLFVAGVLLSIYRERLLTLPDRIKQRQGIFRVFAWR